MSKVAKQQAQAEHSSALRENLALLRNHEAAEKAQRTVSQRVCERVTFAAGKAWFMGVHALWFAGWIAANQLLPKPFDPFPFSFLTFIVSLEAIFLSLAILLVQSREDRLAEERAKLDLQVNLLAEREATKVLELLRALCLKHGLAEAQDPELLDLLTPTRADRMLDDLAKEREAAELTAGGDSGARKS